MKKVALLSMMLAALAQSAFAGQKEAGEELYREAKPLGMVGPFLDSKGCLWGVVEEHGAVSLMKIVVDGKQVCHKPQN